MILPVPFNICIFMWQMEIRAIEVLPFYNTAHSVYIGSKAINRFNCIYIPSFSVEMCISWRKWFHCICCNVSYSVRHPNFPFYYCCQKNKNKKSMLLHWKIIFAILFMTSFPCSDSLPFLWMPLPPIFMECLYRETRNQLVGMKHRGPHGHPLDPLKMVWVEPVIHLNLLFSSSAQVWFCRFRPELGLGVGVGFWLLCCVYV